MRIFIRDLEVYTSCKDRDLHILVGRQHMTLYVTKDAYNNMSKMFAAECKIRDIHVSIVGGSL